MTKRLALGLAADPTGLGIGAGCIGKVVAECLAILTVTDRAVSLLGAIGSLVILSSGGVILYYGCAANAVGCGVSAVAVISVAEGTRAMITNGTANRAGAIRPGVLNALGSDQQRTNIGIGTGIGIVEPIIAGLGNGSIHISCGSGPSDLGAVNISSVQQIGVADAPSQFAKAVGRSMMIFGKRDNRQNKIGSSNLGESTTGRGGSRNSADIRVIAVANIVNHDSTCAIRTDYLCRGAILVSHHSPRVAHDTANATAITNNSAVVVTADNNRICGYTCNTAGIRGIMAVFCIQEGIGRGYSSAVRTGNHIAVIQITDQAAHIVEATHATGNHVAVHQQSTLAETTRKSTHGGAGSSNVHISQRQILYSAIQIHKETKKGAAIHVQAGNGMARTVNGSGVRIIKGANRRPALGHGDIGSQNQIGSNRGVVVVGQRDLNTRIPCKQAIFVINRVGIAVGINSVAPFGDLVGKYAVAHGAQHGRTQQNCQQQSDQLGCSFCFHLNTSIFSSRWLKFMSRRMFLRAFFTSYVLCSRYLSMLSMVCCANAG